MSLYRYVTEPGMPPARKANSYQAPALLPLPPHPSTLGHNRLLEGPWGMAQKIVKVVVVIHLLMALWCSDPTAALDFLLSQIIPSGGSQRTPSPQVSGQNPFFILAPASWGTEVLQ